MLPLWPKRLNPLLITMPFCAAVLSLSPISGNDSVPQCQGFAEADGIMEYATTTHACVVVRNGAVIDPFIIRTVGCLSTCCLLTSTKSISNINPAWLENCANMPPPRLPDEFPAIVEPVISASLLLPFR